MSVKERFVIVRQVDLGRGWFDTTTYLSPESAWEGLREAGRLPPVLAELIAQVYAAKDFKERP